MDLGGTGWLQDSEWFGVLASPFVGSFVATAVERFARNEKFLAGRSHCDSCGQNLAAYELVPLASWVVLRGRCGHCGARIGWRSVATEAAFLAVAAVTLAASSGLIFWVGCLLGWVLLALALIDIEMFVLPDVMTLPLIAAGFMAAIPGGRDTVFDHALAAGLGFIGLYTIARVYRVWTGREGLGMGDAKLFAATGAWLGTLALPGALFIAAATALIVEAARRGLFTGHDRLRPIAFGPYLAFATWVGWIAGPLIPAMS